MAKNFINKRVEVLEKALTYLLDTNQISLPEELARNIKNPETLDDSLLEEENFLFSNLLPKEEKIEESYLIRLMMISGYPSVMDRLKFFESSEDLDLVKEFFDSISSIKKRKITEKQYVLYLDEFLIPSYNGTIIVDREGFAIKRDDWKVNIKKIIKLIISREIDNIAYYKKVMIGSQDTKIKVYKEQGIFDDEDFGFGKV